MEDEWRESSSISEKRKIVIEKRCQWFSSGAIRTSTYINIMNGLCGPRLVNESFYARKCRWIYLDGVMKRDFKTFERDDNNLPKKKRPPEEYSHVKPIVFNSLKLLLIYISFTRGWRNTVALQSLFRRQYLDYMKSFIIQFILFKYQTLMPPNSLMCGSGDPE